jgi:hypothetical protein
MYPIAMPQAPVRHEDTWCSDDDDFGSNPEDSGEGDTNNNSNSNNNDNNVKSSNNSSNKLESLEASSHVKLPGRVKREWNGVDMYWNLAPKLTKVCDSRRLLSSEKVENLVEMSRFIHLTFTVFYLRASIRFLFLGGNAALCW